MKVGKVLNEAFDHVYVKNIKQATRRLESFKEAAELVALDFEVFEAIQGSKYVPEHYTIKFRPEAYPVPYNQYLVGNYATTLGIHLDAMRHEYNSYVVCDDDTVFNNIHCESFLTKLPPDWDILILGDDIFKAQQNQLDALEVYPVTFTRMQNKDIAGCHCVAYNRSIYWTLMQHCFMNFDSHGRFGDVTVGDMTYNPDIHVYTVAPNLCLQERIKLTPYTVE
jgi:hypothetical protein